MAESTLSTWQRQEDLPPDLAEVTLRFCLALADSKHQIGMQLSHWVTGTPALEAAVGAAAMTQDELGHARSLYAVLRHFPGAPVGIGAENDLQARQSYFVPAFLGHRWQNWLMLIGVNVLLDRALQQAIGATVKSAFAPLAGRAQKMLQEESFHRIFGDSWLQRLAGQNEGVKLKLQEAVDLVWPVAFGWLGPDDDPDVNLLLDAGILRQNSTQMRESWLAEVTPLLVENKLQVPAFSPDWSTWDGECRQLRSVS